MNDPTTEVRLLLDAGAAGAKPTGYWGDSDDSPDVLSAVVPDGYRITHLDVAGLVARYRPAPRRVTGTATVTDTASWLAYVGKHGNPASEVFADVDTSAVTAILNAPRRDQGEPHATPAWGDHRVVLQLTHTASWLAWTGRAGKFMSQTTFAEHVEERTPDFVTPTAADMLEVAQTFQQTKGVKFESSQRLADGQTRFQWLETVESKAGTRGDIVVPTVFELRLQPWRGCAFAVPVTARLRSRTGPEGLQLGYVLDNLENVVDAAWSDLIGQLTAELPSSCPVLAGIAPAYDR